MTAKPNDNDVNSREYWERAVNNPVDYGLNEQQVRAMRDSLNRTDPEYWAKVLAAPDAHEFNAEQAKHLAEWATKPRHERNQLTPAAEIEAEAGFHEAFYGAEHVRTWLEIGAVSPMNAALLLHSKNPSKYKGTPPDFGEAFDLMILAFEDVARDGRERSLHDWLSVARDRELTGHGVRGWTACSQVFLAKRASLAQQADSQSQVAPLATPESHVPVEAESAPGGEEPESNLPWWQVAYDIHDMAQNIGAKLRSEHKRTSNAAIAKKIEKRINDIERSKGRDIPAPNHDTIRGVLTGWKWKPD